MEIEGLLARQPLETYETDKGWFEKQLISWLMVKAIVKAGATHRDKEQSWRSSDVH